MKLAILIVFQIASVCVFSQQVDETIITEECDYFHLTSFGLISFLPDPMNAENSKYYCRKLGSVGFPILNTPEKVKEVTDFIKKCHGNRFSSTVRYGSQNKNLISNNTFIRIGVESKQHKRFWPDGFPLSLKKHENIISTELKEKDNFDVFFSNDWSLPVSLPECSELLLNTATGKIEPYNLCESKDKILEHKSLCCHGEIELPFLCWFHTDEKNITLTKTNIKSPESKIWVMLMFIVGFVIGSFIVGCFIKRRSNNSRATYGDRLNLVDDCEEVEFENSRLDAVKYQPSTEEKADSVSISFVSSN